MVLGCLIALVVLASALMMSTIHQVNEGYIAIYFRGGAILNSTSDPGWHLMMPFITSMSQV